MTLREKQSLFARLLARLLLKMELENYEYTLGEVQRPQDAVWGHPDSNHKRRLAADIHLFVDEDGDGDLDYQDKTENHEQFGIWWEQQHELCRWGGRFGDGNHYSLAHEGRT